MAIAIGTTASNLQVVAASKSCTLSINKEMIEKAPTDAGFRSYMAGMAEWSISAYGLYAIDGARNIATRLLEGTEIYLMFYADTEYISFRVIHFVREKYSGKALVQSVQATGSIDGYATYSVQIQGTGKLYIDKQDEEETDDRSFDGTFEPDSEKEDSGGIKDGSEMTPIEKL